MPNPRITFRVPTEIYDQLPSDAEARSEWLLDAIKQKLSPPEPEDELGKVKRQLQNLDAIVQAMRQQLAGDRLLEMKE
jgi:hypothetical protein